MLPKAVQPVVVGQLLQAGADVALRDTHGNAALDIAAAAGKAEAAAALVDAGADPMLAHPGNGRTPLAQALLAGQCQTAAAIVPIPAPGDIELGRIAAQNCDGDVLISVLGAEALMADPDQPDAQGRTLVWLAASKANASAVDRLLQEGADPELAGPTVDSPDKGRGTWPRVVPKRWSHLSPPVRPWMVAPILRMATRP